MILDDTIMAYNKFPIPIDVTVLWDSNHGDWKTSIVFPDRWPTIEKGTKVQMLGIYENYYGRHARVVGPNEEIYDIDIHRTSY